MNPTTFQEFPVPQYLYRKFSSEFKANGLSSPQKATVHVLPLARGTKFCTRTKRNDCRTPVGCSVSFVRRLRAGCSTSGSVNCTVLEEQHRGNAGVPVTLTQSLHLQSHTGRYT